MNELSTLYVVSDDSLTLESAARLAGSMNLSVEIIASADCFENGRESAPRGCVIVDAETPQFDSLDALLRFCGSQIRLPAIVVSPFVDTRATVRAMKLGALTVLKRPFNDYELFESIREALLQNDRTRRLEMMRREIEARLASLNPEERSVLDRVVAGRTNKSIAAELDVSIRTVELRRRRVYFKMKAGSVAELVRMTLLCRRETWNPYHPICGMCEAECVE